MAHAPEPATPTRPINASETAQMPDPEPDGPREIAGERAFPIYRFDTAFAQPAPDGWTPQYRWQVVEGRPDRKRNTSGGLKMMPAPLTEAERAALLERARAAVLERWPDAEILTCTLRLAYWETWCAGWFSHSTLPEGRDDAALLSSFERYVRRHEGYQHDPDWKDPRPDGSAGPRVCLMGAEDRWRWTADHTAPDSGRIVCRCEGCTGSGLVRICH